MYTTELLGVFAAHLDKQGVTEELRTTYEQTLAQGGVEFPGIEYEVARWRWDANAARLRGEVYLNNDGSIFEDPTFDFDATGEALRANQGPARSAERLDALVRFGLLSSAGSLAVRFLEEDEPDNPVLPPLKSMAAGRFKQFVQTGLLVEEWPAPWQELVASNFAGKPLPSPLDGEGVRYALANFYDDTFADLRSDHFGRASIIRFSIYQGLAALDTTQGAPNNALQIAAGVGVFHRQAPEGTRELLMKMQEMAILPQDIDWPDAVATAVQQHAGHNFREP